MSTEQDEIDRLRADIARHVEIAAQLATENAALRQLFLRAERDVAYTREQANANDKRAVAAEKQLAAQMQDSIRITAT